MTTSQFAVGRLPNGESWRMHYQIYGNGPDVIFLHGAGPGTNGVHSYEHNIGALSKEFRCWLIDFPGWGKSSKNFSSFEGSGPFQKAASAVSAFMDARGLNHAHLFGHSFGATAALRFALENPGRVDKLVLVSPSGGVNADATGPTEGILQLLTYYLGEGPTLEKMESVTKNLVYDKSMLTAELIRERFEDSMDPENRANPPLTLPSGSSGAEIFDNTDTEIFISLDPRLANLPHRTFFIWGLQDKMTPVAGLESFKVIPNADFLLLTRCGHLAHWEHAGRINDAVTSFLLHAN